MSEQDLVYSHDEEVFNDTTLADAVHCADAVVGEETIVYSGVPVRYKASDLLIHDIYELICEGAYEEAGEFCDEWPDASSDHQEELKIMVKSAIDHWAALRDLQPRFYTVKDVKPIRVLIEEGGFSEVGDG